jgi:hypothetical protein
MTTAKFTLHVSSFDASQVWPFHAREHPEIDARIEESYYADPDECCASIEIRDMDDLRAILKFYDESRASFILGVSIETPDFKTYSSMDRTCMRGGFHANHTEAMSPGTAAAKLRSMAQAMEKWERDEAKK